MSKSFTAAGKLYNSWEDLCVKKTLRKYLVKDVYGRVWAYTLERYPCFDSFDRLHENRYFRWFVYREPGKFTLVSVDDGKNAVTVTENADDWRYICREMLQELGWIS